MVYIFYNLIKASNSKVKLFFCFLLFVSGKDSSFTSSINTFCIAIPYSNEIMSDKSLHSYVYFDELHQLW